MNINTSTCEKKSPRCQGSPDPVPGSSSDTGVGEEKKNLTIFPPILLFRVCAFSIQRTPHLLTVLLQEGPVCIVGRFFSKVGYFGMGGGGGGGVG